MTLTSLIYFLYMPLTRERNTKSSVQNVLNSRASQNRIRYTQIPDALTEEMERAYVVAFVSNNITDSIV